MPNISTLLAKIKIYLIKKVLIFLLLVEKVNILIEYTDFVGVILIKLLDIFLKYTGVNENAIKL